LGISTMSCSHRCPEYCACKSAQRGLGEGGQAAPLTSSLEMMPTPILTGGGTTMTGIVVPKESLVAHFKAAKRHRATHVTTTLVF
jgi:hypothetical protein